MALINCPECGRQISDKATTCPGCGLPASYFVNKAADSNHRIVLDAPSSNEKYKVDDIDTNSIKSATAYFRNALITFEQDYRDLFSPNIYIDSKKAELFRQSYRPVFNLVPKNQEHQMTLDFLSDNDIDEYHLNQFETKMTMLDDDIEQHNDRYVEWRLNENNEYFDHILDKIDPNIKLDEEQRRAVITDDNHCLSQLCCQCYWTDCSGIWSKAICLAYWSIRI